MITPRDIRQRLILTLILVPSNTRRGSRKILFLCGKPKTYFGLDSAGVEWEEVRCLHANADYHKRSLARETPFFISDGPWLEI